MTDHPIRGKIAAILTPRSVAINKGSADGVKPPMRFYIYLTLGPIKDPDNPERVLMENLSYTKGTLKVTKVFEHVAICEIEATTRTVLLPGYRALTQALTGTEEVRPQTEEPMVKSEAFVIGVGDTVEEIRETPVAADTKSS